MVGFNALKDDSLKKWTQKKKKGKKKTRTPKKSLQHLVFAGDLPFKY